MSLKDVFVTAVAVVMMLWFVIGTPRMLNGNTLAAPDGYSRTRAVLYACKQYVSSPVLAILDMRYLKVGVLDSVAVDRARQAGLSLRAYRVWQPHLAGFFGDQSRTTLWQATIEELELLGQWYRIAKKHAPLYALSGLTLTEAKAHLAAHGGPDAMIRVLAALRGWDESDYQAALLLSA